MMVARAIIAEKAALIWYPGKPSTDVALVLSVLKQTCNRKGGVSVSVFSDPLPWNSVHGYFLQLIDGNWLNLSCSDRIPGDIESGCEERVRKRRSQNLDNPRNHYLLLVRSQLCDVLDFEKFNRTELIGQQHFGKCSMEHHEFMLELGPLTCLSYVAFQDFIRRLPQ